ncbi:mobilization protein [Streptomyces profundus]|uniref:mobilization protein n=1 Tax=Streptomyces profundus TaxID=2867410 RepID=UPI001D162177|nr:mobilization protein [Streptomyces sp. MA3_2.13]UED85034.1 mobilization protein [Streptomyces sp. MA3_2.13]
MIAKITRGGNTGKLIAYLYGPGRANEHTDPHLVASWEGFAPDPGRTNSATATAVRKQLVNALDLRVHQAGQRAPSRHVWHCSIRAAPQDHHLTDAEWADIARRVVAVTGIAPEGDPDGCRWVAVRHADDHIHIAATTVRGDLRPARHWNDYLTADRELARIEIDYALRRVPRGDRTAASRPTRAEREKAHRAGHTGTARECLRTLIRTAVAAASSPEEFLALLAHTPDVLVELHRLPSGDIRGYKAALRGDTNAAGEPVWYAGSTLAEDLSWPRIRQRLPAASFHAPASWHRTADAIEGIPHHLHHAPDPAAQAHINALGETLDLLPLLAPPILRAQLQSAAAAFERATRSRIRAQHDQARALRTTIRALLRQPPPPRGDATFAMLVDALIIAVIAAHHWHRSRRHDQQAAAAHQTLVHLHAAYRQATEAPPLGVAHHPWPQADTHARHLHYLRRTLPAHAQQIIDDPAFPHLSAALSTAEAAGHELDRLLRQATHQRPLDNAHAPARLLIWRIQRLTASATSTRPHPTAAPRQARRHR